MSKTVVSVLKKYKAKQAEQKLKDSAAYTDNDLVCARPDGTPMNPETVGGNFRTFAHRQGYEISFHILRHTHATLLMKAGIKPKVVSDGLDIQVSLLRWTSIAT